MTRRLADVMLWVALLATWTHPSESYRPPPDHFNPNDLQVRRYERRDIRGLNPLSGEARLAKELYSPYYDDDSEMTFRKAGNILDPSTPAEPSNGDSEYDGRNLNDVSYLSDRRTLDRASRKIGLEHAKDYAEERPDEVKDGRDGGIDSYQRFAGSRKTYERRTGPDGRLPYEPRADETTPEERLLSDGYDPGNKDPRQSKRAFNDVGDVCIDVYCKKLLRGSLNYLRCVRDYRCFG